MPVSTFLDGVPASQLRGAMWLALSDVGYVVGQVSTDDTGGGVSQVWSAGTVAIPCRIDALAGGESIAQGRLSDLSTHVISVPPNSVPTPIDRFAIDGKGTFEITAIRNRTRDWLQLLEVVQIDPVDNA